jgi:hypothetical protein
VKNRLKTAGNEALDDVRCSGRRNGWLTFEHDNAVSKVRGHDEVVLNDEGHLFSMQHKSTGKSVMAVRSKLMPHRLMTLLAMIRCSESRKL